MGKSLDQMSDEEIGSLSATQVAELSAEQADNTEVVNTDETIDNDDNTNTDVGAQDQETTDEGDDDADASSDEGSGTEGGESGDDTSNDADANQPTDAKPAKPAKADKSKPTEPAADADPVVPAADADLKSFHAAITAPFKANGREIKVESAEEARQLMQMGANYNKKMQGLKPHLTVVRTLENAGIGEKELNFLIDLHNKVPEAINKLVKDSEIDPMDLSADKADGYKPKNHKASDAEVELETVLAELDGSEGLTKTLDVVTKQWDKASKEVVGQNPRLLKVINEHIELGLYDQIAAEVDRQRTFGRLTGLTDLEAYRQVGDSMHASGKFAAKGEQATQPAQRTPAAQVVVAPDPKKADDSKRKEAKRAVAPVKGAAPSAKLAPDFNPLSLSDEEFTKQFGKS